MTPEISIIVAVWNNAKTLQRCIDSVYYQSYPNKELIIIDGGSKDGTVEIIEANNNKITFWDSKPDNGISQAWNKGLERVAGNWILFLGSDDYLSELNILEIVYQSLRDADSQGIKLVYGKVARVTEGGDICSVEGENWKHTWNGTVINGVNEFVHQGMFFHKDLFKIYGKYNESLKIVADYEMLIRAFKNGGEAIYVNDLIIAKMQVGGITTDCIKLVKETVKARQMNQLKSITPQIIVSYAWAILFPFIEFMIGKKNTRILLSYGKRTIVNISKMR